MLEQIEDIPSVETQNGKKVIHGSKFFDNFYTIYNRTNALRITFTKTNFKLVFVHKPETLSWRDSWRNNARSFMCKFKEAYKIAEIIDILLTGKDTTNFPPGWNTIVHFPNKDNRKETTKVSIYKKVKRDSSGNIITKYIISYTYDTKGISMGVSLDKYELLLFRNILIQNVPMYAIKYNYKTARER